MTPPLLVKRHGRIEEYDSRKVYASVYAASLNAHVGEQTAEETAEAISQTIEKKVKKRQHITSDDIKGMIIEELGGEENDIAYLYVHHLDIC